MEIGEQVSISIATHSTSSVRRLSLFDICDQVSSPPLSPCALQALVGIGADQVRGGMHQSGLRRTMSQISRHSSMSLCSHSHQAVDAAFQHSSLILSHGDGHSENIFILERGICPVEGTAPGQIQHQNVTSCHVLYVSSTCVADQ